MSTVLEQRLRGQGEFGTAEKRTVKRNFNRNAGKSINAAQFGDYANLAVDIALCRRSRKIAAQIGSTYADDTAAWGAFVEASADVSTDGKPVNSTALQARMHKIAGNLVEKYGEEKAKTAIYLFGLPPVKASRLNEDERLEAMLAD